MYVPRHQMLGQTFAQVFHTSANTYLSKTLPYYGRFDRIYVVGDTCIVVYQAVLLVYRLGPTIQPVACVQKNARTSVFVSYERNVFATVYRDQKSWRVDVYTPQTTGQPLCRTVTVCSVTNNSYAAQFGDNEVGIVIGPLYYNIPLERMDILDATVEKPPLVVVRLCEWRRTWSLGYGVYATTQPPTDYYGCCGPRTPILTIVRGVLTYRGRVIAPITSVRAGHLSVAAVGQQVIFVGADGRVYASLGRPVA